MWKLTGNLYRATRAAAFAGQVFAFAFIALGVITILHGSFLNGLWLVFIGWFPQNAAAAGSAQSTAQASLNGVKVAQAMASEYLRVPVDMPLYRLVEERVLAGGQRHFLVEGDGRPRVVLSLRDVTAVPREWWGQVTTGQVMSPWERLIKARPDIELMAVLRMMAGADVAQAPVVEGDKIVGRLSRDQALHYICTRAEVAPGNGKVSESDLLLKENRDRKKQGS